MDTENRLLPEVRGEKWAVEKTGEGGQEVQTSRIK